MMKASRVGDDHDEVSDTTNTSRHLNDDMNTSPILDLRFLFLLLLLPSLEWFCHGSMTMELFGSITLCYPLATSQVEQRLVPLGIVRFALSWSHEVIVPVNVDINQSINQSFQSNTINQQANAKTIIEHDPIQSLHALVYSLSFSRLSFHFLSFPSSQ